MRCQKCGDTLFSGMCEGCGINEDKGYHFQLRADKRFELMKAMAGGIAANPSDRSQEDFDNVSKVLLLLADAILVEMYGEGE